MLVTYQTRCTINILQHLNVVLVVVKSPFHFLKEEEKNTSTSKKLIPLSLNALLFAYRMCVSMSVCVVWFYFLLFISLPHNIGRIKCHNCT